MILYYYFTPDICDCSGVSILCLVLIIWTGRRMWKWVLNVKYLLLLPFLLQPSFTILGTFKDYKGALTQKRLFLVSCTTFHVS